MHFILKGTFGKKKLVCIFVKEQGFSWLKTPVSTFCGVRG